MQVFVIINKVGTMTNADVNVKNWLIKEYAIRDLFGIKVIVNVNVIIDVMLENNWIIKTFKCRKRLIDKLFEECSESIDENKMTILLSYILLF